jgi:hypothetical protein
MHKITIRRIRDKKWLNDRIRDKKLLECRIRDNLFSTTSRHLPFKVHISIKEDTILLNLWIIVEFDPLYKNV